MRKITIISLFLILSFSLCSCSVLYKPSDVMERIEKQNFELNVHHEYFLDSDILEQEIHLMSTENFVHFESSGFFSNLDVYLWKEDNKYYSLEKDMLSNTWTSFIISEEEYIAGKSMFGENSEETISSLFSDDHYKKTSRFHFEGKDGVDFTNHFEDYRSIQMELGDGMCTIIARLPYGNGELTSQYIFKNFGSVSVSLPAISDS